MVEPFSLLPFSVPVFFIVRYESSSAAEPYPPNPLLSSWNVKLHDFQEPSSLTLISWNVKFLMFLVLNIHHHHPVLQIGFKKSIAQIRKIQIIKD